MTPTRVANVAFASGEVAPQFAAVLDDALGCRDHVSQPRDQVALLDRQHELEQVPITSRRGLFTS
jgi:hypothetical protein